MMVVSALCLSRGDQAMLDAARAAWDAQVLHPAAEYREFVVVVDEGSPVVVNGKRVEVPAGTHLGKRRNVGLAACAGDIVAVWDDDDGHEPERLAVQLEPLRSVQFEPPRVQVGFRCTFLQDVLIEFADGYRAVGHSLAGWPQTLVAFRKDLIKAGGWSETAVHDGDFELLMRMQIAARAQRIEHGRALYRYRQHAGNVTGQEHWDALRKRAVPFEKATWIRA